MNLVSRTGTVPMQEWTDNAAPLKIHANPLRLVHHSAERASRNWTPRVPPVDEARKHVAEQARAFIDVHFRGSVHMEDLSHVTGVGVRTVQRCFKACFGMTPTKYLKDMRLDAACRDLIKAYPSQDSVTKIALHNGCSHLGRFSSEFRKRFGQLPKEVLKKEPLVFGQYRGGPQPAFPKPQSLETVS